MTEFVINYKLNDFGDRNSVRMAVVKELSKEEPGKGKNELASYYTYIGQLIKIVSAGLTKKQMQKTDA